MPINQSDLNELKRLATNSYDGDKKFLNRIIAGISDQEKELSRLRGMIVRLEKE